jgi:uncharacterized membrane protein YagU involved in acid resistance
MQTLLRGVVAGLVGTAAMTAAQLAAARARGRSLRTPVPETWSQAPAPAQVAKRAVDALGTGDRVTKEDVPLLTNVMHWSYGTALGVICAFTARGSRRRPLVRGLRFGAAAWTASYAQLVPLGIYEPPWRYPAEELALDLSYHLVYGAAAAEAWARF